MNRDPESSVARRAVAVAVGLALAAVSLGAWFGAIASTRVAGTAPGLARFGPGKLGELRALELDASGRVPAGFAAVGRKALPSNPLAYEPFFAVAAESFRDPRAKGSARDAALLREAVRRDPRSREARLLLMRYAAATGDLGEAVDQLAALNRLNSPTVSQLMTGLGKALSTERQIDEAVAALDTHRELYAPFIRGFAAAKKPAALVVRLVRLMPPSALGDPETRQIVIRQMIDAQAFAEARALWGTHQGPKAGGLIYSPDFAERTAPPPFNWLLMEDSTGVAERLAGGGLRVEYYGREAGPLVSQLLTLAPGAYRAVLDYRGESGTPGGMALEVQCAGAASVLARAPLDAGNGASQKQVLNFAVPKDACRGQMLRILGLPLEERLGQAVVARMLTVSQVR